MELPNQIVWRGLTFERIPPKDSMDSVARYRHGHWQVWTGHLPDQKIAHQWHAIWGYREWTDGGGDGSLGYVRDPDPVAALDRCLIATQYGLRTTMATLSALASRMNVLSAVLVQATGDVENLVGAEVKS